MGSFFAEGGFWMWPIAGLGIAAIVLGAMGLGTRQRGVAMGGLTCSAIVMLLAVTGTFWGRMQTDRAIDMVEPRDAELIREQGYKEANRPIQLGGSLAALGALLSVAGFTLSQRQRSP